MIDIPFGAKDSELQEVSYHIPEGFHAEIQDDKVFIKKGKNYSWSEGDEAYKLFAISAVEDYYDKENPLHKHLVDWLQSLENRVIPQSKKEWSEGDANTLNRISAILVDASEVKNWWKEYRLIEREEMIRLTDFLKSLRPKPHWEPSEEQIDALKEAVYQLDGTEYSDGIDSLYIDLKNL